MFPAGFPSSCQLPSRLQLSSTGRPYRQANLVGLISLQRKDIFRRNVGPFFLTKFIISFVFSVKGVESVSGFPKVPTLFSSRMLGEIQNPGALRWMCGHRGWLRGVSPYWRLRTCKNFCQASLSFPFFLLALDPSPS